MSELRCVWKGATGWERATDEKKEEGVKEKRCSGCGDAEPQDDCGSTTEKRGGKTASGVGGHHGGVACKRRQTADSHLAVANQTPSVRCQHPPHSCQMQELRHDEEIEAWFRDMRDEEAEMW